MRKISTPMTVAVAALAAALLSAPLQVSAQGATTVAEARMQAPDTFIKMITADVFAAVKADPAIRGGDLAKLSQLVDTKIMPYVNFQRMTASAVGRGWRQATADQRQRLQAEFKSLLLHTYSGAAAQIKDQTVEYRPVRSRPEDTEVVVRTLVRGQGEPIQIDYRLEKAADGWKIYDVNVLGAWLVQTYQSSFAQEVNASGIDGLIAKLVERNKQLAARKAN